jgi:AraC-like DNA-binding protein
MATFTPSDIGGEGELNHTPGLQHVEHTALSDPADLYAALNASAPIKHCRSLVPDRACLHRVGYVIVNGMVIVSYAGTPTDFLVEDNANLHLLVCFSGALNLGTVCGSAGAGPGGALLLPAGLRHSQGHHSLASITISVLQSIDQCLAVGPQVANRLGLDDVIYRLAATLLNPALLTDEPADLLRHREQAGRSSFDELIDYIRANLDQPLRLSDLEVRSHYSRRALQYAFRERLGVTPKQWIREQRLLLAYRQLQADGPRPTVLAVALTCGYVHASQFAKDFKRRFGVSPSEVRRPGLH